MTYFPDTSLAAPPQLSTMSLDSIGMPLYIYNAPTWTSGAWGSANRAWFVPFVLRKDTLITSLFTANGGVAGNSFDIGIYSVDGTKIVSTGATAQTGTNAIQVVSITPFTIGPGQYYFGLAMNGTTGTFLQASTTLITLRLCGVYLQTSAYPLPATATFATPVAGSVPCFGLSTV